MPVFLTFLLFGLFQSNLENVFTLVRTGDWNNAAIALDQVAAEDPDLFALNNLPYLRGRIAEAQQDWRRSSTEFSRIPSDNPLRPLAAWHAARVAIRLGDLNGATLLAAELPVDFPADLKMQLAAESPPEFAVSIYQGLTSREARLRYALARNDALALWALLRERNADDVGLQAARALAPRSLSPPDAFDIAEALLAHRQFSDAIRFYRDASADPQLKAESGFQIARAHFLSGDYGAALDGFIAIAAEHPGSDWQKDAEYQAASCYWRMGEYRKAEQAYTDYIARHGGVARQEGAVRNLVDVYRLLGENAKALEWLNRGLAARLTAATRQSLLFTKAKVLYVEKRYAQALDTFRQLGRTRLRVVPGGTTKDELQYYEAMSLSKLGQTSAANLIWQQLALRPLTYYGQKSGQRLGRPVADATLDACAGGHDSAFVQANNDINALRRPMRTESGPGGDAVGELLFLQLWDEAFLLMDRQSRPNPRTAASLAYVTGKYHRAIAYADRLPKSDDYAQTIIYPPGFRTLICSEAMANQLDPLWLHAIIWQESRYNPLARSGASARGLMQFVPDTAAAVAASLGAPALSVESLYDPAVSIQLGARYWATLLKEFKEPELALAAYNGGPDNVRRWKGKWAEGDAEFFVADIGFTETKTYVMAVFSARAAYGGR